MKKIISILLVCAFVLSAMLSFVSFAIEATWYDLDPQSEEYLKEYVDKFDVNSDGVFNINDVAAAMRNEAADREWLEEHGEVRVSGLPFDEFDELFNVFTDAPGNALDMDRNGKVDTNDWRYARIFKQYYENNNAEYPGPAPELISVLWTKRGGSGNVRITAKDEVYLEYQADHLTQYDLDKSGLIDMADFSLAREAYAAAVEAGEEYEGVSHIEIARFLIEAPQQSFEVTLEKPYSVDFNQDGITDFVDERGKLDFWLLDINKDGKLNVKDRVAAELFIELFKEAGVDCKVPDPEDYVLVGAFSGTSGKQSGDVTGDGKLNAKDVIALMKYIVGAAPDGFDESAADVNGDGKVNSKDVVALMKLLVAEDDTGGDDQNDNPSREDFINAFVALDDGIKAEVERAYFEKFGHQIELYSADDSLESSKWKLRCYYADDDYVILFEPTNMDVLSEEEFGDNVFQYNSSFVLRVYHAGDITTLREAFDAGVVSSSAIGEAAERHSTIEEYLRYERSQNG